MPWGLFARNRRGLVVVHFVKRDPRRSRDANLLRVRPDLLLRVLLKLLLGLPDIRDAQTTVGERAPVEQAARRGRAPRLVVHQPRDFVVLLERSTVEL